MRTQFWEVLRVCRDESGQNHEVDNLCQKKSHRQTQFLTTRHWQKDGQHNQHWKKIVEII